MAQVVDILTYIIGIDTKELKTNAGQADKMVSDLSSSIKRTLGGIMGALGIGLGMYGAVKVIKDVVSAYSESEAVFKRVQIAVESTNQSWGDWETQIRSFTTELQKTTRFSDEELGASLAGIINLTGDVGKSFKVATLAADLAAAGFGGLEGTSHMLGIALGGNVERIQRQVPALRAIFDELDKTGRASEKTAVAFKYLSDRFGGAAQKDLMTYSGMLQSLRNWIDEIKEAFGKVIAVQLTPKLTEWRNKIIQFIESGRLEEWAKRTGAEIKIWGDRLINIATWVYEHKDYLVALFAGLVAMKAVNMMNALVVSVEGLATAIKAATISAEGFAASRLGIVLLSGGGTIAGIIGMLGAIGAGWLYIADAAKTGEKAQEDALKKLDEFRKKMTEGMAPGKRRRLPGEEIFLPGADVIATAIKQGKIISEAHLKDLMENLDLDRKYNKITLQEYKVMLEGILKSYKLTGDQRIDLTKKITETQYELEKQGIEANIKDREVYKQSIDLQVTGYKTLLEYGKKTGADLTSVWTNYSNLIIEQNKLQLEEMFKQGVPIEEILRLGNLRITQLGKEHEALLANTETVDAQVSLYKAMLDSDIISSGSKKAIWEDYKKARLQQIDDEAKRMEEAGIASDIIAQTSVFSRMELLAEEEKRHVTYYEFVKGIYQGIGDFAGNIFKGMFDSSKSFYTNVMSAAKAFGDFLINMLGNLIATWVTNHLIEVGLFKAKEHAKTAILATEIAKRKAMEAAASFISSGWGLLALLALGKGGLIPALQTGGLLRGGISGEDSIPLLAEPGEFMMPRRAVEGIGVPAMEYMRQTGKVPSRQGGNIYIDMGGFTFSGTKKADAYLIESFIENTLVKVIEEKLSDRKLVL